MKKTFKQIFVVILLITSLILTLSSCKDKNNEDGGDSTDNNPGGAPTLRDQSDIEINEFSAGYLTESEYNYGEFSDSDITQDIVFKNGEIGYMIVDFSYTLLQDMDDGSYICFDTFFPGRGVLDITIEDAPTSDTEEYEQTNGTTLSTRFSLRSEVGAMKSVRVILRLLPVSGGEVPFSLNLTAGDRSDPTKVYRIYGSTSIDQLINTGNPTLVYKINTDGKSYTLVRAVTGLREATIPDKLDDGLPVTAIADNAFDGCTALSKLTIGKNITTLQKNLFKDCTKLPFLEDGVYYVDKWAIGSERGYTDITLRKNTMGIAEGAFENCDNLSFVSVPDSVYSIGKNAFFGCSSLASFSLSKAVTYIGESAFGGCSSLTEITVSKDNTEYASVGGSLYTKDGKTLLRYASGDKSDTLTLSDSTERIGEYSIDGIDHLRSINIPASVGYIGEGAFYNCTSLTSLSIPQSVSHIGENILGGCASLASLTVPFIGENELHATSYSIGYFFTVIDSQEINSYLPPSLKSITVLKGSMVPNNAFSDCTSLEEIILPPEATSIGDYAFDSCEQLKNIVIPKGVTAIGDHAFSGCMMLSSIVIPKNVVSIDRDAFLLCKRLIEVINLSDLKIIAGGDDYGGVAAYAKLVHTGESLIEIRDGYRFFDSGDENYLIGYVGDNVDLILPESYNGEDYRIHDYAFSGNLNIVSVTIPDAVTAIGECAFANSVYLQRVEINDLSSWCEIIFTDTYSNPLYFAKKLYLNGELLTDLIIPSGTAYISDYAFYKCTSIESVSVPGSVAYIGEDAFGNCKGILNISIESGVQQIKMRAFKGIDKLKEIIIPDSVATIGSSALAECSSLESISIPFVGLGINNTKDTYFGCIFGISSSSGAKNIPSSLNHVTVTGGDIIYAGAFKNCTSITNLTLPSSLTSIGKGALEGCTGLTELTIPFIGSAPNAEKNTHFGYIFGAVDYFKNGITVPSSLVSVTITDAEVIDTGAFLGCASLISITIPETLTEIRETAFSECYRLVKITNNSKLNLTPGATDHGYIAKYAKEINNPDVTVNNVGDYLFYISGSKSYLLYYTGNDSVVTLPSDCNGSTYEIYPYAFYEIHTVTKITLSDGVTAIGDCAFFGCENLSEVVFASSLSEIGTRAFAYCSSLKSINLPNGLEKLGTGIFSSSGLTSITIPDDITRIPDNTFYFCLYLTDVTIPDSLTYIGSMAFFECDELVNVNITSIEKWLGIYFVDSFSNPLSTADNLNLHGNRVTNVTVPTTISKLNDYVFYGYEGLSNITFSEGLTEIGDYAFYNCRWLKSMDIPDSTTSIGSAAFYGCARIESITVPNGVTHIKRSAFEGCSSLKEIALPSTVTYIGEAAFRGCSSLNEIVLPSTVTYIGEAAFRECSSLQEITIPAGVKSLGMYTFYNCISLKYIFIHESLGSIGAYAFAYCDDLNTVYYGGSVNDWKKMQINTKENDAIINATVYYNHF
ncbi:MAG: leucine-rich repeat domain-containing protein [Ruminococcaceae bacterium]|nr:leucine-rich repeat domain-containing protein [Oscillospiraceae bacterium]